MCTLCGILGAIYVLLTTENSNDFEIRVLDGSSYTSEFLTCHFLLVIKIINYTRGRIL